MATLTFPSPTQLKNISGPTDGSDAATKTYVDSQLSDQAVSAAGSNTQVQFNSANSFGASNNFTFNSATSILTVTGNIVSSNANLGDTVTANFFIGSGNNLSNIQGANVTGQVGNALLSGTVYTNAQPNITSVGTLSSLTVTGDISGTNLTLSGNLLVGGTLTTVNSTTTRIVDSIVEQGGGANGNALSSNDNKDRGQLLHYYTSQTVDAFMGWDNSNAEFAFGSNVSVASEVVTFNTFGNVRADIFYGNGSQLTGVSATSATSAGTVTSNAQPNITSVGTLTSLNVSGNVDFYGANVSLGNVSNLHITGGTNGYFLTTDGSGSLSWAAQTALTATVDEFTANGTYTTFTLSTTPSSENVTMVAVQGVLQPKSSYSLMGPQLTFDAAPPASAFIEVTTFSGGGGAGGGGGEALSALYRAYTGNGVANTFTVTSGVTANSVLVAENGILQRPTTDYTIAGSTLTLVTTPANGVDIQIRELSGGGGSSSPALTWNIASSNATMVANNGYFVDTSSAAKTMTLPISATLGDTIRINDLAGSFATNNLTVARNGHKIQGIADNLLVDEYQSSFGLVYSNSTYGWKVLEL